MKYGELTLGQVEAIVNKLGGMNGVRDLLADKLKVVASSHIIDCDAAPFTPNGWKVEKHWKAGQLEWDPTKVTLHLSPNQQNGKSIKGHKLLEELADMEMLNANVLDYLLAHLDLIPEEWKVDDKGRTRYIFFWGTIYRDAEGYLCIRDLYFYDGRWYWGCYWLDDDDWRVSYPAARLAS